MSLPTPLPLWPQKGERYVWEMLRPHAAQGVEVIDLHWNGNEWIVWTEGVTPCGERDGRRAWHTIDRFREACQPYRAVCEMLVQFGVAP